MSIAIINASVGGLLTVAGTTTLSGALTTASTINSQGITSTGLLVNGSTTTSGLLVNGTTTTSGLVVNGSGNITLDGNITASNLRVNGITTLKGDLVSVLPYQTTGTQNVILGVYGGVSLTTGSRNLGLGVDFLGETITGSNNIAIGFNSGGGVLANDNICIGRNTGIEPSNTFSGSSCIGQNSKITASNQVVLGTDINNVVVLGNLVAGSTVITNASLGYLSGATSNIQNQFTLNTTQRGAIASNVALLQTKTTGLSYTGITTAITGNSSIIGNTILNDNGLYLRSAGDTNHSLIFNTASNGPALQGFSGGRLGTLSKGDILTWNTTGGVHRVDVGASLQIATANEIRMNNAPLYLKATGDNSHFLQYIGAPFDGPALQGNGGGRIGTVTKNDIITWASNTGVHSVALNGNTVITGSLQLTTGGYFNNFYRKTNCSTTETFDFQPFHGKYEVLYNANHDRNTTSHTIVDVLNNVNGGSFVASLTSGVSVSVSINNSTNVFTLTSTVTGGTLQINRLMAYI